MPIKPENRARYPKDWKLIRASVLTRAGNRCERCKAPNHQRIARGAGNDAGTYMLDTAEVFCAQTGKHLGQIRMSDYEVARMVDVVLTVAHLDHTPENCDPDNLRAWCQKCHLAYDAEHHAQTAQRTRREALNNLELF